MKLTELKENYDNYLELNYNSEKTIICYKNCFKKFIKENDRIYRMSNIDLKKYFINFKNNYSQSYFNQMLSSVTILYNILKQYRKLKDIKYLKTPPKKLDILSKQEILNGLKNISNTKHQLVIKLLYVGALRISELLNLKLSDIDRRNKRIIIRNSKGNKGRYIPISDNIIEDLTQYYIKFKPNYYIFKGVNGKYSETSVRNIVKKINLKKHIYPHLLRHSSITKLIDDKHNILKVQIFAGHNTSKSTERYYHLSNESLNDMTLNL